MRRTRVSIKGLMALILAVGVAMVSIRQASPTWAGIIVPAACSFLIVAALGVIYRSGSKRAFWVGFVLMGWGYLGLHYATARVSVPGKGRLATVGEGLITGKLLDDAYPRLHPKRDTLARSSWFGGILRDRDPKNQAIAAKLEMVVPMPFAAETPLEEVLKAIKAATSDPSMPAGIPIYVDPVGLQEAEKTMMSPISLSLEGVRLRTSLELLLKQLDLTYELRDGLVSITYVNHRNDEPEDHAAYLQIGHAWLAIVAGVIGGLIGRRFYATREAGGVGGV